MTHVLKILPEDCMKEFHETLCPAALAACFGRFQHLGNEISENINERISFTASANVINSLNYRCSQRRDNRSDYLRRIVKEALFKIELKYKKENQ